VVNSPSREKIRRRSPGKRPIRKSAPKISLRLATQVVNSGRGLRPRWIPSTGTVCPTTQGVAIAATAEASEDQRRDNSLYRLVSGAKLNSGFYSASQAERPDQ
jgi:hypothetical protein